MRTTNLEENRPYMEFDKPNIRTIAGEITEALKVVGDKYGLAIEYLGSTYNPNEIKFRLSVTHIGKEHKALKEDKSRKLLEIMYPKMVDAIYVSKRFGKCIIVGYNPRGRKYPFICRQVDAPNGGLSIKSAMPSNWIPKKGE